MSALEPGVVGEVGLDLEGPLGLAESQAVHILGVDYTHTCTPEGGDLYLTAEGCRWARHLGPANWFERSWFRTHRVTLRGTGAVYAVNTRPVDGESLGLVVKFSRVGERVPLETRVIEDLLSCEFNGPFEEIALVEELRRRGHEGRGRRVETQFPLAIYVQPETTQMSRSGRFQWRIDHAVGRHPGVAIDILRDYILLYGWLPGIDASEAQEMGLLTAEQAAALTDEATEELRELGFRVLDMKAAHVIVRPRSATELESTDGRIERAVIDYELMERTPEHEAEVREARQQAYARRRSVWGAQAAASAPRKMPAHLATSELLGVDYVYGRAESTGGALWVVGRDPELFDLFVPERWRTTAQVCLKTSRETFLTESKDDIRLVWKVSSVGDRPEISNQGAAGFRLLAHGFNSPFEEVAFARWLQRRGVPTVLPLAVYRTGHHSLLHDWPYDSTRYRSHEGLLTPDGDPVLETRRNYMTLWEDWHGPDQEAEVGRRTLPPLDAEQGVIDGWLTSEEASELVEEFGSRLDEAGVEALRLTPSQLLISRGAGGRAARDERGLIAARLANLEFLKWRK